MIRFEWDNSKALKNIRKHRVDFLEAISIFSDPFEITILDPDHSIGEYRFLSIGKSIKGNLLVISYTEPKENSIRIISARLATKNEKKQYEQRN
jgi:uncharacterized DUF497 family protein